MLEIYIKQKREEMGLTQKELSRRSGVSSSHIGYIENGDREPSLLVICKIADALNVDVKELYKYTP